MMKGVKIVTLLLLSVLLLACRKEKTGKDLTVIFATTTGLVSDGYNELIINAVMEGVSAQPNVTVHLLKPDNIAEARSQFNEWLAGAGANKALILCGPEFESLVQGTTLEKGRILLLDSDKTYGEDISTALLKRYGGAWLAGALTKDFKMLLIKGLDGDRIIDIISQGFEDGYKENGGAGFRKYVLSTGYEGLNMPDELCSLMWDRDELDLYDLRSLEELVVPVCGSSSLGAFSFCRTWYYGAVGVGDDCAPYSDTVPFSLILDLGGIVKEYFTAWVQDSPWPAHADFGMNTGHVRISFNERFYSHILGKQEGWPLSLAAWQALENQYKDQAFEKEADHAY